MERKQKAFIALSLGALILAGTVLFNSLSKGTRTFSHLVTTYPVPLVLSLICFVAFFYLSRD